MEVKPEYLAIFSEEASDQLVEWEECLLALEKDHEDTEQLNGMFRAVHTLKGSAGFIGFDVLQRVAHALESSLSEVREGKREYDSSLGDILFRGLDLCKAIINAFTNGKEPDVDVEGFLGGLSRLAETSAAARTAAAHKAEAAPRRAGKRGGKSAVKPAEPAEAASPASAPPEPPASALPAAAPPSGTGPLASCRIDVRIDGDPREAYLRSFLVKARLGRMGTILGTDPAPEVPPGFEQSFCLCRNPPDPRGACRRAGRDQFRPGLREAGPGEGGSAGRERFRRCRPGSSSSRARNRMKSCACPCRSWIPC